MLAVNTLAYSILILLTTEKSFYFLSRTKLFFENFFLKSSLTKFIIWHQSVVTTPNVGVNVDVGVGVGAFFMEKFGATPFRQLALLSIDQNNSIKVQRTIE
jgi:hypothetical protein